MYTSPDFPETTQVLLLTGFLVKDSSVSWSKPRQQKTTYYAHLYTLRDLHKSCENRKVAYHVSLIMADLRGTLHGPLTLLTDGSLLCISG